MNQKKEDIIKQRKKFILIVSGIILVVLVISRFTNTPSASQTASKKTTQTTTAKVVKKALKQKKEETSYELTTPSFNQDVEKVIRDRTNNPDFSVIIQTNENWGKTFYGTNPKEDTLAENGCALAVLAMINSYWTKEKTPIQDILKWTDNRFFIEGKGTDWIIFSMFAEDYGYYLEQTGNFDEVEEIVKSGKPVIASLSPGTFTDVGHFLIITVDTKGNLMVVDPNDSPKKKHYEKNYNRDLFIAEAVNYWILSK